MNRNGGYRYLGVARRLLYYSAVVHYDRYKSSIPSLISTTIDDYNLQITIIKLQLTIIDTAGRGPDHRGPISTNATLRLTVSIGWFFREAP